MAVRCLWLAAPVLGHSKSGGGLAGLARVLGGAYWLYRTAVVSGQQSPMLVVKGQSLDFQIVRFAQETDDTNAEGMCSQFGVESSTQAPQSMGAVGFNRELCFGLTVSIKSRTES